MDHYLRRHILHRLQQDRVHIRGGGYAAGIRLQTLGPADFLAVRGHIGVQGHILGFEGSGADAVLYENPAQSGGQDAFAHIRSGPLKHNGFPGGFYFRLLHTLRQPPLNGNSLYYGKMTGSPKLHWDRLWLRGGPAG
ncbi:hypothetical protein D3C75_943980 [compost metagenome]